MIWCIICELVTGLADVKSGKSTSVNLKIPLAEINHLLLCSWERWRWQPRKMQQILYCPRTAEDHVSETNKMPYQMAHEQTVMLIDTIHAKKTMMMGHKESWFCIVWCQMVSVRTFSVINDYTLFHACRLSDQTSGHMKRAVCLVTADNHLNLPQGLVSLYMGTVITFTLSSQSTAARISCNYKKNCFGTSMKCWNNNFLLLLFLSEATLRLRHTKLL